MRRILGLLLLALSAGCAGTSGPSGAADRPNFILIFADDMGYGDLGCYGHPTIATPHLDRMAREGAKFTEFYVASSVCTPSRAGLLTGRYPLRSGMSKVLIPSSKGGLPAREVTLAETLRDAGYATACVGKWHLGWQKKYLPTRHGFDSYFGVPYSNDMSPGTQPGNPVFKDAPPTPLIRNETVTNPHQEPDQRLLTRQYTDESIAFIRKHAGRKPFFLYLAHTMPHVPLYASDRFEGRSRRGLYGDTIEEIDGSAGEVLRTLKETGADRDTLVVFTSDNGPWLSKKLHGGSAGPFFEGKVSTWEGGFRVPAIFRWPGKIAPGVVTGAFGTTMDLFTTFTRLGGGRLPTDRPIDGKDLTRVLLENAPGREPLMHYYFGVEHWAVRKGPWKLHLKSTKPASVTVWGAWKIETHDPPLLYHLGRDPGERRNVAEKHPEVVAELLREMEAHAKAMKPGTPQR